MAAQRKDALEERPFIAIWETTTACDLACSHCRARAQPDRRCGELTTDEGRRLLEQLGGAGVPLVVLTGGDPAKRPDLLELVAAGKRAGMAVGLAPSATPLITEALLDELARAGISRLAISLDAAEPGPHDRMRGVDGSFDRSLAILAAARARGIPTQVNTSIHLGNIDQLRSMAELVKALDAALWSVFLVVPTGRATAWMLPRPERVELALEELADIAEWLPCAVKTTAAPHYRRVLAQRKRHRGSALRVNDGRGFLFVNWRGDVCPSGFLPIRCGNVREQDVLDIYRNDALFRELRDPDRLLGKCGRCEYRSLCGGSRARAYAVTGNALAEDPACAYVPER